MKRNVTMHDPDTWVVRLEGDDQVAIVRQKSNIAPRRVVKGQVCFRYITGSRIIRYTLIQDGEVVAVEMDRMLARNINPGQLGHRMWSQRRIQVLRSRNDVELNPYLFVHVTSADFSQPRPLGKVLFEI